MKEKDTILLALLYGGLSAEREVSIAGAGEVKGALDPARYEVFLYDTATDIRQLVEDAPGIDVAFLLLHGPYGEDGTVQGLLELLKIPYQGSGVLGSAVAMDKNLTKTLYASRGIRTPEWLCVRRGGRIEAREIVNRLGLPLMVKPCSQGSSIGMSMVEGEADLPHALDRAFEVEERAVLEQYISGREITGGVLGLDRPEALPIVEIRPGDEHLFFDTSAKYDNETIELCPAPLDGEVTLQAQKIALAAHDVLGLRAYSRTDMMVTDSGEIFAIETNTIPGMTPASLFPKAASAAGISFSELLDRLIDMALSAYHE